MSKRTNRELLTDVTEAIEKVMRYTEGMKKSEFLKDEKTVDAVVRNFEIIGEAANRVEASVKERFPEIPWRRIVGLRNRIVHDYFGIDLAMIWEILKKTLPEFKSQIGQVLAQLD